LVINTNVRANYFTLLVSHGQNTIAKVVKESLNDSTSCSTPEKSDTMNTSSSSIMNKRHQVSPGSIKKCPKKKVDYMKYVNLAPYVPIASGKDVVAIVPRPDAPEEVFREFFGDSAENQFARFDNKNNPCIFGRGMQEDSFRSMHDYSELVSKSGPEIAEFIRNVAVPKVEPTVL